jgi:hypothetical protein
MANNEVSTNEINQLTKAPIPPPTIKIKYLFISCTFIVYILSDARQPENVQRRYLVVSGLISPE